MATSLQANRLSALQSQRQLSIFAVDNAREEALDEVIQWAMNLSPSKQREMERLDAELKQILARSQARKSRAARRQPKN